MGASGSSPGIRGVKSLFDEEQEPESDADVEAVFDESSDASESCVYSPSELLDDIVLSSAYGVGSLTAERLVERFGSAREVLNASVEELTRVDKVGEKLAARITNARNECDPEPIVRFCEENDISILHINDSRYPARLRNIPNPPRLLYVRGEYLPRDSFGIAIVGTRNASPYGRDQAARFGRELVEAGFTVVSGLALGIDGCAHRAALDSKGRTIAVLGGGVARIFPREHEDLAARVISSGALMSEYHPLMDPLPGNFPARNRIVSGLSIGVLVVESSEKGGSMITARLAAEQNREVFAVPGRVDSPGSRGCHQLIREGAALIETIEDIIEALPHYELVNLLPTRKESSEATVRGTAGISRKSLESIARRNNGGSSNASSAGSVRNKQQKKDVEPPPLVEPPVIEPPLPPLNDDERKLVDAIGAETIAVDVAIRRTGLPAARVVSLISILEIKRVLCRREGNAVSRRR